MADSDEEYVQDLSEGEDLAPQSRGGGQYGTRLGTRCGSSERLDYELTNCQLGRAAALKPLGSLAGVKNDGRTFRGVGI